MYYTIHDHKKISNVFNDSYLGAFHLVRSWLFSLVGTTIPLSLFQPAQETIGGASGSIVS